MQDKQQSGANRLLKAILLLLGCLMGSCMAQRPSSGVEEIQKIAGRNKINTPEEYLELRGQEQTLRYCFLKQADKIFFINASVSRTNLDFLKNHIDSYQGLTDVDLTRLQTTPYLRELYCGDLFWSKQEHDPVLYTVHSQIELSIEEIAVIHGVLQKSLPKATHNLHYVQADPIFYQKNKRAFSAHGIILDPPNKIEIFQTQFPNHLDSQDEKETTSSLHTSNKESGVLLLSPTFHTNLLKINITTGNCEQAFQECHEKLQNLCQKAHGICTSKQMESAPFSLKNFIQTIEQNKDGSTEKKLAADFEYLRSLLRSVSITEKCSQDVADILYKHFPSDTTLAVIPWFKNQENSPHINPIYLYLGQEKHLPWYISVTKDRSDQNISLLYNLYSSLYTPENHLLLAQDSHLLSDVNLAFKIYPVVNLLKDHGYGYIYPLAKHKKFSFKIVFNKKLNNEIQSSSEKDQIYYHGTTAYFDLDSRNRITHLSRSKQHPSQSHLKMEDISSLALKIKKNYLELRQDYGKGKVGFFFFEKRDDESFSVTPLR